MKKQQQTSERWYPNMFYFNIKKTLDQAKYQSCSSYVDELTGAGYCLTVSFHLY